MKLFNVHKIRNAYKWLNSRHLIIAFIYLLATAWYMGPALTSCNTTTYSFGDNTAGLIWRYNASPSSPFWGYEDTTNYPVGESLTAPTVISGTVQFVSYWLSAKVFGPVCGLNILNVVSFVSAALVMYGFMLWITKKKYIAFLIGFLVSFAPYFQIKIGAHPVYGFQAIFIGLIWLSCALYKKPTLKKSLGFGFLASVGIFSDPYFVLLVLILVSLIGLTFILGKYLEKSKTQSFTDFIKNQQYLVVAGVFIAVSAGFLIIYKQVNEKKIDSYVSNARGNVLYEARACSNYPQEYFMPFAYHYIYENLLGRTYVTAVEGVQGGLSCGYGEDTVGINPIALLAVLIAPVIVIWELINGRKQILSKKNRLVLWTSLMLYIVALGAALIALPPYKVHGLPTPSQIILDLTTTWRTINRLYVLVNIAVCALFGIILWVVGEHVSIRRTVKRAGYLAILLFTLIQYQIFQPLHGNSMASFNYEKDANPAYYFLRDYDDAKVIAEYPLEKYGGESDAMSYYLTMQSIHGKKMLNGILSNSEQENIRSGLKDLSDPQTIPSLRSLGIDTIVVHGLNIEKINTIKGVELVHISPPSSITLSSLNPNIKEDFTAILRILPGDKASNSLMLTEGFPRNTITAESAINWTYEVQNGARIAINDFDTTGVSSTCIVVRTALDVDSLTLTITDDKGRASQYSINGTPILISGWVSDSHHYTLNSSNLHNMRITQLGCN